MSSLAADISRLMQRQNTLEQRQDITEASLCIVLSQTLATMTEEEAIATAKPLADELAEPWSGDSVYYPAGKLVSYGDAVYMVRTGKSHTSQPTWSPDVAHSEFALVLKHETDDPSQADPWVQPQPGVFDGYPPGALVAYDDKVWRNTYEAGLNVWGPPGFPNTYWEIV